jgi:predicted metal-dependent hydrolase
MPVVLPVQGRLLFDLLPSLFGTPPADTAKTVVAAGRVFPVVIRRHRRARRYLLRVTPDGVVRLTVPARASIAGGMRFAAEQAPWIAREWSRQEPRGRRWEDGTEILFRGTQVPLACDATGITFAGERLTPKKGADARAAVEAHLRAVATRELPARCLELAASCGHEVKRVSVRNQRSRWGSCSTRGTIALNWRLIQMPPAVSDYVILHELMHLRQPNHSRRFWREVATVCPGWREAERWLRASGRALL